MDLYTASRNTLIDIRGYLIQIEVSRYTQPLDIFSGATIGQHTRHILEFYKCLLDQYKSGVVNYDLRTHDTTIESSITRSIKIIDEILETLTPGNLPNVSLRLEVNYNSTEGQNISLNTTLERELIYNIEHAIHHMAIIKIGIQVVAPEISLPSDFGIAASTIRYRQELINS